MDDLVAFLHVQIADEEAGLAPFLLDPRTGLSDDELHDRRMHPAYEYEMTEGQRKAWPYVDDPPEKDAGWELNITLSDPDAFERSNYVEYRYWRRLRLDGPRQWKPSPSVLRDKAKLDSARMMLTLGAYLLETKHIQEDAHELTDYSMGRAHASRSFLVLLALPYADHPDYREEWRP
jgi:hypothetical protein